jgi:hypothetical protein
MCFSLVEGVSGRISLCNCCCGGFDAGPSARSCRWRALGFWVYDWVHRGTGAHNSLVRVPCPRRRSDEGGSFKHLGLCHPTAQEFPALDALTLLRPR